MRTIFLDDAELRRADHEGIRRYLFYKQRHVGIVYGSQACLAATVKSKTQSKDATGVCISGVVSSPCMRATFMHNLFIYL